MQSFAGKTAVITGAGSGLGLALAHALAKEGANLMLADVNASDLAAAEESVRGSGTVECTSTVTDVAWKGSVDALAERTHGRFGKVHLLFNNAGVAVNGPLWESTEADWEWLIGVNLLGVVYGIQAFVPKMLEHGEECHVVNTASVAGLITPPGFSAYTVTKHAAVALSEVLFQDLRERTTQIGVSVLCPAYFPSRISDSDRNRPSSLRDPKREAATDNAVEAIVRQAVERGRLSTDEIARITLDGIRANRFYILPHEKIKGAIEKRMQDILLDRTPTNPMARGLAPEAPKTDDTAD
jgi:NAD(P)-dependent dehydrogenase (short-subunit alcohol dehydrogenase family)